MRYIARDKYFNEEFFDSVTDIVEKYYNIGIECKVNGIKYTSGMITVMGVAPESYAGNKEQEWNIRITNNKSNNGFEAGYDELNKFIQSKLRDCKLDQLGI